MHPLTLASSGEAATEVVLAAMEGLEAFREGLVALVALAAPVVVVPEGGRDTTLAWRR